MDKNVAIDEKTIASTTKTTEIKNEVNNLKPEIIDNSGNGRQGKLWSSICIFYIQCILHS